MTRFQPSALLRNILILDGASCIAAGALMAFGAAYLTGWLALPEGLLRGAGAFLIVFGALVFAMARRAAIASAAVVGVIACNIVWATETLAILAAGWVTPNAFGVAFILAQALWVAVLAAVQVALLRRDRAIASVSA